MEVGDEIQKPPSYNVITHVIGSISPNHMWAGLRYSKQHLLPCIQMGKQFWNEKSKKISKQTFPVWVGKKKKITCHSPTVINLKYMLFHFQRNEGILMLYHNFIYFSPGSVWSALKTVDQFCIKIPSFCLLLQSAIKYAEGNTGMFPRYHGSNKTCNRGVFLEKVTTTFPLTPPQALSSPYDIPLFPFLVLVKNINQKLCHRLHAKV